MTEPLPPCGPELAFANRRILAERQHWPDGALQECEHLDSARPGWTVCWRPANTIRGFERPAGFYAQELPPYAGRNERQAYAATAELLAALLI